MKTTCPTHRPSFHPAKTLNPRSSSPPPKAMLSTIIFITYNKTSRHTPHHHHLFSLIWARPMGGGPRTFPGGLNKWQWKRLHEKKARDKERRLLDHEKQLYQARLRSQIRASASGQPQPDGPGPAHGPMSPKDHIRALADRFVKAGAEDLWNDDDGPVHSTGPKPDPTKPVDPPIDLRKLFRDGGSDGFVGFSGNLQQRRGFSVCRRFLGDGNAVFGGGCVGDLRKNNGNAVIGDGYVGNSQKRRFLSVGMKFLDDGNVVLGDGYVGNLQQRRYFSVGRRSLDDGNVVLGDRNVGHLQESWGFWRTMRFLDDTSLRGLHCICQQKRGFSTTTKGKVKTRYYNRKNESSSSDDEDYSSVRGNAKWPRFSLEGESEEEGEREGRRGFRGFMGNAALGKHDVKTTRRRIVNDLEKYVEEDEEDGLAERISMIRQEVNERKSVKESECTDKSIQDKDEFISSRKRFEDCGISPLTVKALTSAGYVLMTSVQEATLPICLEGKDALVKAGSGTGKTAAFLLPAIETVLKAMSDNKNHHVPPIYVLILCPTRELASQITAETRVMLKYHDGLGVQMLAGGTRFKDDIKRLESDPCQILVATPGRLLDHVETKSSLSVRLMGLKMFILDEADKLLDLGFRKDVEKIVDCLPRRRQSLLFSATIPKEVRRVSQLVLKREHDLVNATDAVCPESSSKVKQSYIIVPHDEHFQIVYGLLKEHTSEMPDYKVIVFCTTGMVTSLMYHLFREMRLNVREIHTRKPQLYRSRIAEEFKQSKRLILFSSDISARGLHYPDVTLVIQVGIPPNREQYMHRLGRTGREGKDGEGILLIAPWEEHFLEVIRDMPIEKSSAPHIDRDMKLKIEDSMAKIDMSVKEAAYHGWLGYYNSVSEIGRDKTSLVQWANQFCNSIGLQNPPALFRKTVINMGLKGIPGIRIRK